MLGIYRLILALGEAHVVFCPQDFVGIVLGQPSVVGLLRGQHLLQAV
jgi:hypothetical protein